MARLTKEEKLKSIEQKQADLEMQKKKLQAEINKEKRNARTKRLIEIGAMIESLLGMELETQIHKNLLRNLLSIELYGYGDKTFADLYREELNKNEYEPLTPPNGAYW